MKRKAKRFMIMAAAILGVTIFTSFNISADWSGNVLVLNAVEPGTAKGGHINWAAGSSAYQGWQQDIYADKMRFWSANNNGDNFVLFSSGDASFKGSIAANGSVSVKGKINTAQIRLTDSTGTPYTDNWIGMVDWLGDGKKWLGVGGITDTDGIRRIAYVANVHSFQGDVNIIQGNFTVAQTITAQNYACASDVRFKKDIKPLTGALDKLLLLNSVTYFWKTDAFKDKNFSNDRQIGFIAQDVEKIYPELVYTDSKGYKAVSYDKFTVLLTEAVKELKVKNDTLAKENEVLKNKVASLEKMSDRIAKLEARVEKENVSMARK